jgi:hypothetical protein
MANEELSPSMAPVLANLATATGYDRATMAVIIKALAELTDFMQSQAAELRRIAGVDTLVGIASPTQVVPGAATGVRGNGRARTFEWQNYKTKSNT